MGSIRTFLKPYFLADYHDEGMPRITALLQVATWKGCVMRMCAQCNTAIKDRHVYTPTGEVWISMKNLTTHGIHFAAT